MEYYQQQKTYEYRNRKIFSFFPFFIPPGKEMYIIWAGTWCKWIEIKEEKFKCRYSRFDEWTCQFFWSQWIDEWEFVEIVNG